MIKNNRRPFQMNWQKDKYNSAGLKFFLFLLSPVLGLIYSLQTLRTKSTYIIIFLFCLTFGLAFTVSNVRTEGSIDGITYRAEFEDYEYKSYDSFEQEFQNYITFESAEQDFYFNSLAFLVSRFTSNYHIFFLCVAFVFAFFQLKSLRFFTLNENFSNTTFCIILFFLFIWNQIFNINGVRFWTGAWIAVYSCFQIFVNGNKKYFLLALLTPLVHGGYFLFLLILIIYSLFGRFEKLWVLLFLGSFVVSTIIVEVVGDISTLLPGIFARKAEYYTDSQLIAERSSGTGFWFVDKFFSTLSYIYINLLVIILIFKNNRKPAVDVNRSLLRFLIVLMVFSNVFMPIPSLGGRFIQLSYPLIAYLWLSYFSSKKYSIFIYILPFIWFMNIYHMLVLYWGVLDWSFFLVSPVYQVIKNVILF